MKAGGGTAARATVFAARVFAEAEDGSSGRTSARSVQMRCSSLNKLPLTISSLAASEARIHRLLIMKLDQAKSPLCPLRRMATESLNLEASASRVRPMNKAPFRAWLVQASMTRRTIIVLSQPPRSHPTLEPDAALQMAFRKAMNKPVLKTLPIQLILIVAGPGQSRTAALIRQFEIRFMASRQTRRVGTSRLECSTLTSTGAIAKLPQTTPRPAVSWIACASRKLLRAPLCCATFGI